MSDEFNTTENASESNSDLSIQNSAKLRWSNPRDEQLGCNRLKDMKLSIQESDVPEIDFGNIRPLHFFTK